MHAAAASVGNVEATGEASGADAGALTVKPRRWHGRRRPRRWRRRCRGRRRGWRRPWPHGALLGHSHLLARREEGVGERAAWPRSKRGIRIKWDGVKWDRIKWDRIKRYGVADAHPLYAGAGCRKSCALMLSIIIAASGCVERVEMALRPLSMRASSSGFIAAASGCRAT